MWSPQLEKNSQKIQTFSSAMKLVPSHSINFERQIKQWETVVARYHQKKMSLENALHLELTDSGDETRDDTFANWTCDNRDCAAQNLSQSSRVFQM
jgi:hypothetical protein